MAAGCSLPRPWSPRDECLFARGRERFLGGSRALSDGGIGPAGHDGAARRPAALAAATLGIFHLVAENTSAGWHFTDLFGRAEGHWAALLTGRPLLIGASFGGVDFLVVMTALATAWHRTAPQPSIKRAVAAGLAIAAVQTIYLVVLAFSHDLAAMLPVSAQVINSDVAHMGVWSWSNAALRNAAFGACPCWLRSCRQP